MSLVEPDAPTSDPRGGRAPVGLAAVLEALPTSAALLETTAGIVVAANDPWRRFHAENGVDPAGVAVGGSYLRVCDGVCGTSAAGAEVSAGLRAVLAGARDAFEREYALASGDRSRWYLLVVRRVVDGGFDGAIVLNVEVTARREESERAQRTQVERRVSERTGDLSRANVLLEYEIGERRRAAAERNLLLDEVRLERRLLAAVLAQMPLGVMIAEAPSGRVVLHNEQLARLVGSPLLSSGAALLTAGGRAFHPDGRAYLEREDPLLRALHGESVHAEEIELARRDGAVVILRASAVPVRDEPGGIIAAVVTYYDVTEWRTAERQLRASETRYRLASRAIKDAIWDLDVIANRIDWSEGITSRFGHPAETVEPSIEWWLAQIDPDERDRVGRGLRAALAGTTDTWHDEYRFRSSDGRWADVVDRGFIVRDPSGRAVRAVGAMEDVSERRRAEAERAALLERERRARADAEAANRAKDEFLAVVSHELRTPLAPILGFVEILREDGLNPPGARAALATIERNARSLSHLIDDLLDVSRITSGKMSLEYAELHLGEIVAAAVESARPSATAKGVQLVLRLGADRDVVAGDAARLTQVAANLLSNAVKFTPQGGAVTVAVSRRGNRVELSVRDTGKGITAELLPHVFDRFRQGDTSDTRVHGGLGLGLAIVRHIVDLHGGGVTAASDGEGRGVTFTVVLPLSRAGAR
jgi:PAS domain S-box-containing protein